MSLKGKYSIVGLGYTPVGKFPDRSALSFKLEAAKNAIEDAGLEKEDVDGLIDYRSWTPLGNEWKSPVFFVAQQLGISPNAISQESFCSRNHIYSAIGMLESGQCENVVITYGDNSRYHRRDYGTGQAYYDKEVFGQFGAVSAYAMHATRAMHLHGTGPETWKEIAVSQRKWANLNPDAVMHGKEMTYDDYHNSKKIVYPFKLADCAFPNDGGRAYVVTSTENAHSLKHEPAVILGLGQHSPSKNIQNAPIWPEPTGAKVAGEQAMNMACVTLDDIDALQVYDCFTYTVEATLRDYGFFAPDEGQEWFSNGKTAPGGSLPVNTSGGSLSEAYLMGNVQISEAAMQLMGRCGQRQLGPKTNTKEPEIIMCSDNGGQFQTNATVILGKEVD